MTEPDPVVLRAVAQLAGDLLRVGPDTAWARLAHLTPEQRAEVERVMDDATARLPAPAERSAPMTRAEMDAALEARRNDPAFQLRLRAIADRDRAILKRLADN